MKGKEQVEQQVRCTACGAVWGRGFVRKAYFQEERDLNCPFCSAEKKAVRELVSHEKPK